MKINRLTAAMLAGIAALTASAQSTPLHPIDINSIGSTDLIKILDNWQPGQQLGTVSTIDDQFYIGRTRPVQRIAETFDASTQANSGRKILLWSPMDEPTSNWKALPRYNFNNDNFSMWSYLDTHGNWSAGWWRAAGGLLDVAHKNGVKVGCVLGTPWASTVKLDPDPSGPNYNQVFAWMTAKDDDGNYKNLPTLARFLKYYGIDNMGVNSEFYATKAVMEEIQEMFYQLHRECEAIGWEFEMTWYDGTSDSGSITFDRGLGSHNTKMFGSGDHIVTDQLFFNYNWTASTLNSSVANAKAMGRNSFDVFAGFDIEGRGLTNRHWSALSRHNISIGLWGTHMQSQLYKSSVDDGSGDMAMQNAYQRKLELVFSGGYRNPAFTPGIATDCSLANSSLENTFHGLATFATAKSSLGQLPFITRFNLGNGLKFYQDGKVAFNSTWYNINTQDWMPTWRWWITNAADEAVKLQDEGVIVPEFTFDDAWFGGTSLSLSGKTACSRLKLFKTAFDVTGDNEISAVYKVKNGGASHAKLFVAMDGNLNSYKEIALPDANGNNWTSFSAKLSDLGISSGVVALVGVVVENTDEAYNLLLGELAISNPAASYAPVTPAVKEVEVLRGRNSSFDFKMRYEARDESDGSKTYNDEVDTWYYEIYSQQEGGEPQLLTATTSWATYVVGAPIASGFENRRARFGVRPVAPDGSRNANIGWSDYYDVPYTDSEIAVVADRTAIKPNEEFTLSMTDDMAEAMDWTLTDCLTGDVVYSAPACHAITLSLPKEGIYDLQLTNAHMENVYYMRGKVQVTTDATGRKPVINDLKADKYSAEGGEVIRLEYTSEDGEGMVSRALRLEDPRRLMIPGAAQRGSRYTYALWVKPNKFTHAESGTNLINKFDNGANWPASDWGQLWFPIQKDNTVFLALGGTNALVMGSEHALQPGVWTHVAITQDDKKSVTLYVNGKKVSVGDPSSMSARTDERDENCHIYVGGVSAGKASLEGDIDELQIWNRPLSDEEILAAMKGFNENEIPEGLQAYYNFERVNDDNTIPNLGHLGSGFDAMVEVQRGNHTAAQPNCEVPGWPGIVGTLAVKTTPEWMLPETSYQESYMNVADVTYYAKGDYKAGVKIANFWGSDEAFVDLNITTTGVEEVAAGDFFIDVIGKDAYVHFGEDGDYTINLYDLSGRLLQSNALKAEVGGVAVVSMTGNQTHLLQVVRNGKPYAAVKIAK